MKKIPEIRFSEFSGEWVEKRLGEVCKFYKGKGISKGEIINNEKWKMENGKLYKCIRYGELYTTYSEIIKEVFNYTNYQNPVLSIKNDVLIPSSGETAEDISTASCILEDNVAIGGDINILRCNLNGQFLAYYLKNKKKKDIAKLAQGVSVVHLYANNLKSLKIHIPPTLEEQQKIAEFLSKIDEKIEIVTKKIEELKQYKKGLLQKMLNVTDKGEPELRFKEFSGKWVEKRLGAVGNIITGTTPSTKIKSYYDNGAYPWVTPTDINDNKNIYKTERQLTEEGIKKGRFIPKNSLLVTCIASIGKNVILRKDGSCNQQINAIIPSKNNNVDFLYYKLETMKNKLLSFAGQTATPILNKTDFSKIKIHIPPTIEEQQKIADFLSSIDEKIELNENKLKALKKYKQGLLQKMFV